MTTWLSKIEESNRRAQEVRKRHVTLSTKELPRERMARVLRELGEAGIWANKLVESMDGDSPDKVTLVGLRLGKLRQLLDNLSDDAKELLR